MAEAEKTQQQSISQSPSKQLEQSSEKLAKYGGFDLLEATIDGVQNMNPDRKARKKIFLTESNKEKERKKVKKTLEMWASILSGLKTYQKWLMNLKKDLK